MLIDIAFDFRSDATCRDPDRSSPTLRRYHQLLWSKRLPGGHRFDLDTVTPWTYLHHGSEIGEFWLSSDSVIATFSHWQSTAELIRALPPGYVERFDTVGYTIGGMMIFPSNPIGGQWTINQARGCNVSTIGDRMDLTLECIRRYYAGDYATPLATALGRYADFFALFGDFRGYVDFDTFTSPAVPGDVPTYMRFAEASIAFVEARNKRVATWSAEHLIRH